MDYSRDDGVKCAELFKEGHRDLIKEIKMYKNKTYQNEEGKIICSLCVYGKNMWQLTVHKRRRRQ